VGNNIKSLLSRNSLLDKKTLFLRRYKKQELNKQKAKGSKSGDRRVERDLLSTRRCVGIHNQKFPHFWTGTATVDDTAADEQ
jgi:hypothetical protein